jgi:23S rRNA pseudouridine1911/1915/1917 synthase
MLNRGYAYSTIISSKYHGQILLFHLASLYSHSTPQAWQQKLNNGEVTLNGVIATGGESVNLGQTLVWNRPGSNQTPLSTSKCSLKTPICWP